MVTSTNLALKIWNLSTDPYDSGQLADNWSKVDQHDHSPGKGLQVPTGGIADAAITQAKIAPGVTLPTASVPAGSITTTEISDGTILSSDISSSANIVGSQLAAAAGIVDGQLTSANNGTYKQIVSSCALQGSGLTNASIYLLNEQGVPRLGSDASAAFSAFFLDNADWNVNGRATKFRLRATVYTNSTAPTSTFQIGLYPVTNVAGGAGQNTITSLGPVVTGSQVTIANPTNFSGVQGNSGDFAAPIPSHYAIGCLVTTTMVANSTVTIRAFLQQRTV